MTDKLLSEINEEINKKAEFATWFGMPIENIPQEILDEAFGQGALGMVDMGGESRREARRGEQEWRTEMQPGGREAPYQAKTYRDPTRGGEPTMSPGSEANVGDFVVVDGKPVKIVDKKTMFGGNNFVYLQGMQKPVIADRLNLHKKVGRVNVFAIGK